MRIGSTVDVAVTGAYCVFQLTAIWYRAADLDFSTASVTRERRLYRGNRSWNQLGASQRWDSYGNLYLDVASVPPGTNRRRAETIHAWSQASMSPDKCQGRHSHGMVLGNVISVTPGDSVFQGLASRIGDPVVQRRVLRLLQNLCHPRERRAAAKLLHWQS